MESAVQNHLDERLEAESIVRTLLRLIHRPELRGSEVNRSDRLNALYENYRPSKTETRPEHLEPLLAEVFKTAQRYFYDDDAAQDFTVEVWQSLETLEIRSSFAAHIHHLATWRRLDWWKRQKREVEKTVDLREDEDGNTQTVEEVLDNLDYENVPKSENPAPDVDELIDMITDPVLKRVAELVKNKKTIRQCAEILGVKLPTLYKKIERNRAKKLKLIAA